LKAQPPYHLTDPPTDRLPACAQSAVDQAVTMKKTAANLENCTKTGENQRNIFVDRLQSRIKRQKSGN